MTGYRQPPVVKDERRLREELARGDRRQRALEEEDVVIEMPRRLLLRSPNGHYWAISVSDTGALSASDVGVKPI